MPELKRDKVVVPIDFSDESLAAVDLALSITSDASKLYLVHCLEELSAVHPGELYGTVDDESRARHSIAALQEKFGDSRYEGLHIDVVTGSPGAEIADYAEKIEADLIIMPSHGRTGIARMLIGSVAERTIRHAHCPVLVLRGD